MAQKRSILDQKWQTCQCSKVVQKGPKGTKMVNLSVFDHFGPILGPSGPVWTISDKNDFFAQNGQGRDWRRCSRAKNWFSGLTSRVVQLYFRSTAFPTCTEYMAMLSTQRVRRLWVWACPQSWNLAQKFTQPDFWANKFTHQSFVNCDYFCLQKNA